MSGTRATPAKSMGYRPDIDGLRCIAVLAVVFYHFGFETLSGGFVGVDVFFVISGFLIGGMLWNEYTASGSVALSKFYIRRFRRLAPAFFAMALTTTAVCFVILLPYEFNEFAKSLMSATIYASNIFFFLKTGYFDSGADGKILLHTWSLGVEEQFYMFFPLVFIICAHMRGSVKLIVSLLFVISLVLCVWLTPFMHEATFYLLPFRAWELLAGAGLAIWAIENRYSFSLHSAVSWLGLAIVGISVFGLQSGTHFPGAFAILPVSGALLLIANGRHDNLVNRCLSLRSISGVGLISYSLYLWHWPILMLWKYYFGPSNSILETGFLLTLTFAISFISWRFIERPFRQADIVSDFRLLASTFAASCVCLAIGSGIYFGQGLHQRFAPNVQKYISASQDFLQDWSRCETSSSGRFANVNVCKLGPHDKTPTFLAWGDSHLRAYKEGLALAAQEAKVSGLLIWRAGCPPLFDIKKHESASTRGEDRACETANAQIRSALKSSPSIKSVILLGRWSYYVEGRGVGLDAHNTIKIEVESGADTKVSTKSAPQYDVIDNALFETSKELAENRKNVFVLRQIPELPQFDSRLLAKQLAHGRRSSEDVDLALTQVNRAQVEQRSGRSDRILQSAAKSGQITILDPWPQLCDKNRCSAIRPAGLLYFDNNHLTNFGARTLRQVFSPALAASR